MRKIPPSFSFFIVTKPYRAISIALGIFLFLLPGLFFMESSYSPRIWLADDHPMIQNLEDSQAKFGSDQAIVLGVYQPKGVINLETLNIVEQLTEELWQISNVTRVESLTNILITEAKEDEIIIRPLFEPGDLHDKIIERIKGDIAQQANIENYFLSQDKSYTLIYAILRPFSGEDQVYQQTVNQVLKLIDRSEKKYNIELLFTGNVYMTEAFRKIAVNDNLNLIPVMALLVAAILFFLYKKIILVIVPIALSAITIASSFAIMGPLSLTFNSILSAIPGILFAICLADSIHILTTFKSQMQKGIEPQESLLYSLNYNFRPTFVTSITTSLSFLSITNTDLVPIKDLGLVAAFGTLLAWLFSYLFVGGLLSIWCRKNPAQPQSENIVFDNKHKITERYINWLHANKWPVVIFTCMITLIALTFGFKNEVNSDPIKYFKESLDVRKDYEFSHKKMRGLRGVDIVIDSGSTEGAKDPIFLKKVDSFRNLLLKDQAITQVRSIIEVIKDMNKTFHGGRNHFYRIPDNSKTVGELLLLYSFGSTQGSATAHQLSSDERYLNMRITWNLESSTETEKKFEEILSLGKEHGLNLWGGGHLPILTKVNTLVVTSFFTSLTMALVVVGMVVFLLFKNPFLSLISLLPNIIPLAWGSAMLYFLNAYLDVGTSIVTAVCFGICVDDTIHFISSYQKQKEMGLTNKHAIRNTLSTTGMALSITTLVLVMGFGSFAFAQFIPNRNFGILCAAVLSFALIIDLVFLPAILLIIDKERISSQDEPTDKLN